MECYTWFALLIILESLPYLNVQPKTLRRRTRMPRRLDVFKARRAWTPPGGTKPPTPKGWNESSSEEGPIRNATYDPSFGYEPYWEGGDWVLDTTWAPGLGWWEYKKTTKNNKTVGWYTTKGQKCPFFECPSGCHLFGSVCARNRKDITRTFINYCEYLEIDCQDQEDWIVLYRGKCQNALLKYEQVWYKPTVKAASWINAWWPNSPTTRHTETTTANGLSFSYPGIPYG